MNTEIHLFSVKFCDLMFLISKRSTPVDVTELIPSVWRWKSILIGYRIVIIDASHSSMPFEEWVLQMRCHHGYYKPYLEFPRIRLVSIYYLLIFIVCVNGFWRFTGEPVSPNVQNYDIFSWFVVVKVILLIAWLPFRVLGLDEGIFIFLL